MLALRRSSQTRRVTRPGSRGPALLALTAGLALAAPSVAAAGITESFAAPNGQSSAACSEADPCDIRTAVGKGGDVLLVGGDYSLDADDLFLSDGTDLGPADADAEPPLIQLSGAASVFPLNGSTLHDLRINGGTSSAVFTDPSATGGPLIERVEVTGSNGQPTCRVSGGIIRDSVCANRGQGQGLASLTNGADDEVNVKVRNVTAYSESGSAVVLDAVADSDLSFVARNLIADGSDDRNDIAGVSGPGGTIVGDLDFSNFVTSYDGPYPGATIDISDPGTASNQTAQPLFVDVAGGDFRQAANSPTIDAGDSSASDLGDLDLDRTDRVQGGAIDIGAYEADTTKPTVKITKGPAKKTRTRTATFRFTGSDDSGPVLFSCRLDGKPARPCSSPTTYRNLKPGRHTFTVTGSDDAGNKTTKRYGWKVVKKKRRG